MENNSSYQGDLTDIIRAAASQPEQWQFTASNAVDTYHNEPGRDGFGDPFIHFSDPLIHDGEAPAASGFFHGKPGLGESRNTVGFASNGGGGNNNNNSSKCSSMGQMINLKEDMKIPNCYSRMLQISPASKLPPASSDSPPSSLNLIISNNCMVESPAGLQISTPRNTGIRRRKNQVKKVVCIPAPTPANSRATGEIVPSDHWAWRKYGQKPIKGSPYPRGYYKCSSSKGCSARKQVERSRSDPNMLVITYASEHNHPWPTQRNALAGSTRSQPSKTNGPKNPSKEAIAPENTTPSTSAADVKDDTGQDLDPNPDMRNMDDPDFEDGFPGANLSEDSFFADLVEIEADSMDIFGFSGDGGSGQKVLDPFTFCDWDGSDSTGPGSSGAAATPDPSGCTSSYGGADKDS